MTAVFDASVCSSLCAGVKGTSEVDVGGEKRAKTAATEGDTGEGLHRMFQRDLELVCSQLSRDALTSGHNPSVPSPLPPPPSHQPSVGHRSGFDAFMTGYSLLLFALQKLGKTVPPESAQLLSGLKDWVNCLALRGKDIPLKIVKSHFVKTSVDHRRNAERFGLLATGH